jgi:hypothetical protein
LACSSSTVPLSCLTRDRAPRLDSLAIVYHKTVFFVNKKAELLSPFY